MNEREEKGAREQAVKRTKAELLKGFDAVENPSDAAQTLDRIERKSAAKDERANDSQTAPTSPRSQADAVANAASVLKPDRAASVLVEAAELSAASAPTAKGMIDQAVIEADSSRSDDLPRGAKRGQKILRDETIRRMSAFDAADAVCFISINHLPHPRWVDAAMSGLSWAMTGGAGWFAVLLCEFALNPRRGREALLGVAPALLLATSSVECGIKPIFCRKRPFISIVQAIVVGRKPGSYSFPSGHSAAAFAGALLMSKHFPRHRNGFFALAITVAFSRIYLGDHYPGDVMSGSAAGALLANLYSRLLRVVGAAFRR